MNLGVVKGQVFRADNAGIVPTERQLPAVGTGPALSEKDSSPKY
jgi:hypothetical protein